jgi:hypothetical protein
VVKPKNNLKLGMAWDGPILGAHMAHGMGSGMGLPTEDLWKLWFWQHFWDGNWGNPFLHMPKGLIHP